MKSHGEARSRGPAEEPRRRRVGPSRGQQGR